ncbi:MAG: hypothetical protein A3K60_01675 [Euryarchaeota archaeon RBG_19FT_COMBO_56_21]|nr:MAG: hypothetical protein A3K60_01675 [Euryarchaeota archaeon RBG_19FT_COMBO_56_21]
MSASSSAKKPQARSDVVDVQSDLYKRKLQRILRSDPRPTYLTGGVSSSEPRMSDCAKAATLSPKLINPISAVEEDSPLFQCTQCDMIVRESDSYCPFCGAIFADTPRVEEVAPREEPQRPFFERPLIEKPIFERPVNREPMIRPEKFDLFSMIKANTRSKEMLYKEALKGFAGSARLLEEIEHLISEVGSVGADTSKARRLMGSAWEAARDGNWNLVTNIARQTENLVSPSIPDLVRTEIAKARMYLTEAKSAGVDISSYVLRIKGAMHALRAGDPDEALRLTKELMDSLREDSISWK